MGADGTYIVTADTPLGKQEARMTLRITGEVLTGTVEMPLGKADFTGTINGNDISWNMKLDTPVGKISPQVKGKINGNNIVGKIDAGILGVIPFSGKKA
jgi:hypothetical protein